MISGYHLKDPCSSVCSKQKVLSAQSNFNYCQWKIFG